MLKSGLRLYQAATQISRTEFLDAISRVCPDALQNGGRRLGLAVSGGVDSMALAVMCREYLPRNGTELQALIVDHGLRPSSSEEASKTKAVLGERLGIDSHVLKLEIPRKSSRRAVETAARAQRYEAMVNCCRSLGIRDLLAAHHRGDQYETILLRLSQSPTSSFHIRDTARVPQSLHTFPKERVSCSWEPPLTQELQCFGVKGVTDLHITLRRPLLGFSKDRLIATCKGFDIPWIEDETNKDKSLTARNALRHILAKHDLPGALSENSLLRLAKQRETKIAAAAGIADQLFSITNVELDVRTGSAVVSMPKLEDVTTILPGIAAKSSALSAESLPRVIGLYLNAISLLVEPLSGSPGAVYPEQMSTLFGDQIHRKRFTSGSTMFDPLPDGRWLVSSAPIRRNVFYYRHKDSLLRFGHSPEMLSFRPFDQRWWIKVLNPSRTEQLILRYLRPAHLVRLNERLRAGEIILKDITDPFKSPRNLDSILRSLGPHYLRFWLPVIVSQSPGNKKAMDALEIREQLIQRTFLTDPDAETVLAFPTLNLRIHGKKRENVPWWIEDLQWEVYYKHIDRIDGRLEDSIVLPTTKESRGLV